MESEYLEVAYINFDKVILYGMIKEGIVDGISQSTQIEQVLTKEQKRQLEDFSFRQDREYRAFLRGLVND